jgi:hypothetical protein
MGSVRENMNWYGNSPARVWGPATTKQLALAFEQALQGAKVQGLAVAADDRSMADLIAHYVINRANNGIYDPEIIADGAVNYLRSTLWTQVKGCPKHHR